MSHNKSFIKWPGGKGKLAATITELLPSGKRLLEPFVGSGAIFLNSDYANYVLNDNNPDLIHLFKSLQNKGDDFIEYVNSFFSKKNNTEKKYYDLRTQFNSSEDPLERSALFVYLNRHGFNGLCRYNSSGQYNVPFGQHKNPQCQIKKMSAFHQKSKQAKFRCDDFEKIFKTAKKGDVIYCDPPYVPLSDTASFTNYSGQAFTEEQQIKLADLAVNAAYNNIPVLISNHDTPFTREIYQNAEISSVQVERRISCKGDNRNQVGELLALFR